MLETPPEVPSAMTADVLSDVLRAVRLTGTAYFDFRVRSPWVAEAPPSRVIASTVMPGAQRVIEYHLMAEGSGWVNVVGEAPVRLREGDLVVFPQGDSHVLSSAPGMRATPDLAVFARGGTPLPICYELGGPGADTGRIVCGFLGCDDRPFNPLLDALPRMMHLSASPDWPELTWLVSMVKQAVRESQQARPGTENVLARMSELLFVEAVRQQLVVHPSAQTGWLAGLRDPLVSQALAVLHGAPAEPWTVDRLARQVGASRSVLAERFPAVIGCPPMHYLNSWRMQLASRLLADGAQVAAVAAAVGYDSEAAFSRAFKRAVGQSPAAWGRLTRRASPSAQTDVPGVRRLI